jgi:hypothetical protein
MAVPMLVQPTDAHIRHLTESNDGRRHPTAPTVTDRFRRVDSRH